MTTAISETDMAQRDELVGRLVAAATASLELLHVYLGDRLGLYQALASQGPLTPEALAVAVGISPRYSREWLEQQAVSGVLRVVAAGNGDGERAYSLPPGYAEVFLDWNSLSYMGPLARVITGVASVMPDVMQAFKTGGGVAYERYGADVREGISLLNRPGFMQLLGTSWFPAVPELDRRLRSDPPARVADVGCGMGWSSIGIARAYPLVTVDGFDLDAASIEAARRNADDSDVAGRVTFEIRDAADPGLSAKYDVVTAFETIHDMSDPVAALRAMRGLAREGGMVLVVDEKVADEFTAPGDDVERFMYGWSAVHCLAVGMVDNPSAATGTVMRKDRLRDYAREAGFADVEVLAVEADLWRFYRLI